LILGELEFTPNQLDLFRHKFPSLPEKVLLKAFRKEMVGRFNNALDYGVHAVVLSNRSLFRIELPEYSIRIPPIDPLYFSFLSRIYKLRSIKR